MRIRGALVAGLTLLTCFLAATAGQPAWADPAAQHLTLLGWLNRETAQSELVVLGQVGTDAWPNAQTGRVKGLLRQVHVFNGPRVGPLLRVVVKPGLVSGRYLVPTPLRKDQWALFFLRNERGSWVAPPLGRIVETPFHGLSFYTEPGVVIDDAAPGISWNFVVGSLEQLVATRVQIIDGHLPSLRAAQTREQRERIKLAIEWQVKERLGLPVP